jgi:cytochrome c553
MGIPLPGFKGGFGNSQLIVGPTVVQAVAPPAISGGTLVVLADDQTVVATDPDRDQIYVVDISARRVNATIALNPGDEPGRVISDSSGRVHVALRHAGALVTIDPVAGTVTDRRQVCAAPRGLAHDPTTDLIHVACAGGELVSLPAAGGDAVRRLKLDRDLRDVVVDGDRLLVSRFRAAEILTVDAKGNVSGRVGAGDFRSADARGGQLFTPSVAWRMVGVHGGGVAMVHQRGVDDEIQRGVAGHVAQGSYGGGPTIGGNQCHAIVHSAVTRMMPNGEVLSGPALADLPLPVDMAISADGKTVAIISAGNTTNSGQFGSFSSQSSLRNVHVTDMDSVSDAKTMSCRAEAGRTSCWAGGPTFCTSTPDVVGQAIAVAVTTSGTVIVQSREPAMLNVPYGASIPLSTTSREDTGQKLFHANAGAGLACASCHPEGSDDGRDWNFACAGRRRTQSLQTGIRGTEPFHWDGDEKDFPQLVADVFTGRMSGPELTPDQTDSVLTWIDHQPRPVKAAPVDAAAVERGRAVFDDTSKAGCVTCHAGPQLTNSKTMDVGTGGAFQVPSLVGLANHPPYLHNGCAQTLQDRFSPACGGGDKHGVTSRLGASEISDLISYLETL